MKTKRNPFVECKTLHVIYKLLKSQNEADFLIKFEKCFFCLLSCCLPAGCPSTLPVWQAAPDVPS